MKPLFRSSVLLAASIGLWSCSGDPTDSFRQNGQQITADPSVVFVTLGSSTNVIVQLVDEQGNTIPSDLTISNVPAGITVVEDPTFQSTTNGGRLQGRERLTVTPTAVVEGSFTVSGGGATLSIPVRTRPQTVAIVISNPAPALGDTITLTAPSGVLFTPESQAVFGVDTLDFTALSADSTQLTFVPPPGLSGPITVTHTTVTFNRELDFNITSEASITTEGFANLAATFSSTTPALGVPITITMPGDLRLLPTATVFALGAPTTPDADGDGVREVVQPINVTISADSLTMTLTPPPSVDSVLVVTGVVHRRLPQYPMTLQTTQKVTTPVIANVPATVSNAAPTGGTSITLTSTNGAYTFGAGSTPFIAGAPRPVLSFTASTITFFPFPGDSGNVSVDGVSIGGFALELPSTAPDVKAGTTVAKLAGTDNPATAPSLVVPASGATSIRFDAGGPTGFASPTCGALFGAPPADVTCQVYKLTVATAMTLDFNVEWSSPADLGVYIFDAAGTAPTDLGCDAAGRGPAAHPENCSGLSGLAFPAGTYTVALVNFGPFYLELDPNPDWVMIQLSRP
jgi:hypothetical protein